MKFDFDNTEPKDDWVAALYDFNGVPGEYCVCIKTSFGDEEIWMYPNGEVSVQTGSIKHSGEPIKKFYPCDKLTITF